MKLRKFIKNELAMNQTSKSLIICVSLTAVLLASVTSAITNDNQNDVARQGFIDAQAQVEKITTSLINSQGRSSSEHGTDWSDDPQLVEDPGLLPDDDDIIPKNKDPDLVCKDVEEDSEYDDLKVSSLTHSVVSSTGSTGGVVFDGGKDGGISGDSDEFSISIGDEITVTAEVKDILKDSSTNNGFKYKITASPVYEVDSEGKFNGTGDNGDETLTLETGTINSRVDSSGVTVTSGEISIPQTDSNILTIKFMITEVIDVEDFNLFNNYNTIEFNLGKSNSAPIIVDIEGHTYPRINQEYYYIIQIDEPDGDPVWVTIDWGDGSISEIGPINSYSDTIEDYFPSGDDNSGGIDDGGDDSAAGSGSGSSSGVDPNSIYIQNLLDEYGDYYFAVAEHTWEETGAKTISVVAEDDHENSDTDELDVNVGDSDSACLFAQYSFNVTTGETDFSSAAAYFILGFNNNGDLTTNTDPTYEFIWYELGPDEIPSTPNQSDGILENPIDYYNITDPSCGFYANSVRAYHSSGIGPFDVGIMELTPLFPQIFDPNGLNMDIYGNTGIGPSDSSWGGLNSGSMGTQVEGTSSTNNENMNDYNNPKGSGSNVNGKQGSSEGMPLGE